MFIIFVNTFFIFLLLWCYKSQQSTIWFPQQQTFGMDNSVLFFSLFLLLLLSSFLSLYYSFADNLGRLGWVGGVIQFCKRTLSTLYVLAFGMDNSVLFSSFFVVVFFPLILLFLCGSVGRVGSVIQFCKRTLSALYVSSGRVTRKPVSVAMPPDKNKQYPFFPPLLHRWGTTTE